MEMNVEEIEKKCIPNEENDGCTTPNLNIEKSEECREMSISKELKTDNKERENLLVDQPGDENETQNEASMHANDDIFNKPDNETNIIVHESITTANEENNIEGGYTMSKKCGGESQSSSDESTDIDEDVTTKSSLEIKQLPSEVSVKRKTESLALISVYESSSGSDSDSHSLADGFSEPRYQYVSSNSENSNDTEESESDLESIVARRPTFIPKQVKVRGELCVKDLPPIEDLHISVKEEQCIPFGKVYSIVDTLLVIQSLPDKPALNLDSIFFRHSGDPVGRIFDVFGPVKRPFYSVRFNSNQEIHEKGLKVDMVVYAAPETRHTQYVFAHQLMREKGSDASWVNDCEPPAECIEYSDDEEELNNRRKQKQPVKIEQEDVEDGSPARKRYLTFEKRMNRNNVMRNKYYNKMQNTSPFKCTWDVGWHNRIDRPLSSSPSPQPLTSTTTNGTFQMRPPLFMPPPTTSGCPSLRPSMPIPFTPHHPNQSAFPPFNPHQPPPGWTSRPPPIMSQQRFSVNSPHMPSSIHFSPPLCPQMPSNMRPPSPNIFYQNQHPTILPPPIIPSPFSSPSGRANNFLQFPQFPPNGNSF